MQPTLQEHQTWDLAAFVLALVTFPLCLLPFRAIIHDTRTSTPSRWRQRQNLGLLGLWISMTISHLMLVMHPIVGMFEQVCDDGFPAVLNTQDELRPCKRNYIGTVVEAVEVLTLPVYPALMVSTYMQLLPTGTRKWVIAVARFVKVTLAGLTLAYFASMVTQRLFFFTSTPSSSPSLPTDLASYYFWTIDLPYYLFFVWFFAMVAIGVLAMVLTLQLLPYLDVSQSRPESPCHSTGATTSSTRAASGPLRFGRKSQDLLANTTAVASQHSRPSLATERVQACVRRLKALVFLMLSLLSLCSLMVVFDWFPRVMYVTVGWICGRALTVALFVATREVRNAVMARRLVPANAVGVTLAATAWSGHGETANQGLADAAQDGTVTDTILPCRSISDACNGSNAIHGTLAYLERLVQGKARTKAAVRFAGFCKNEDVNVALGPLGQLSAQDADVATKKGSSQCSPEGSKYPIFVPAQWITGRTIQSSSTRWL